MRQYTSFWNLANYPAAIFPTGLTVDPKVDGGVYEANNADEQWIKETFSADGSVGVSRPVKASCIVRLTSRLHCPCSSSVTSGTRRILSQPRRRSFSVLQVRS
jgi:hypothetical protein